MLAPSSHTAITVYYGLLTMVHLRIDPFVQATRWAYDDVQDCQGNIDAIGSGTCEEENNNPDCEYDGGDCCPCTCLLEPPVGSNTCAPENFIYCQDPDAQSACDEYENCGGDRRSIGDGACDTNNNNQDCGYDGGDCCLCTCTHSSLDETFCSNFDCVDPSATPESDCYPGCQGSIQLIGNGDCDHANNNAACGFDGGDCCECTCEDSWYGCGYSDYYCQDPNSGCDDVPTGTPTPSSFGLPIPPPTPPPTPLSTPLSTSVTGPPGPPGPPEPPEPPEPPTPTQSLAPSPSGPQTTSPPIFVAGTPSPTPIPTPSIAPEAAPAAPAPFGPTGTPIPTPSTPAQTAFGPSNTSSPSYVLTDPPNPSGLPTPSPTPGVVSTTSPAPSTDHPGTTGPTSPAPAAAPAAAPTAAPAPASESSSAPTSEDLGDSFGGTSSPTDPQPVAEQGHSYAAWVSLAACGGVGLLTLSSGVVTSAGMSGAFDRDSTAGGVISGIPSLKGDGDRHLSRRRPSATLYVLLVLQLQFLAIVSLVDSSPLQDSSLYSFTSGLRWTNLWWRMDVSKSYEASCASTSMSSLGTPTFLGNLVLVVSIFLGIFILHLAVVSGMDAYWMLSKPSESQGAGQEGQGGSGGGGPQESAAGRPPRDRRQGQGGQGRTSWSRLQSGSESQDGIMPTSTQPRPPLDQHRAHVRPSWLHFPHLELMFLFFGFTGAVTSQALAIGSTPCRALVCLALVLLLLYPGLLVLRVWRIIRVRIFLDNIVDFERAVSADRDISSRVAASRYLLWSKSTNSGILSLLDKGQWKTLRRQVPRARWEADIFRNGYQAIFVDFTKQRCWFILVLFAKMVALGVVGVLLRNSTLQFGLFSAILITVLILVAVLKPFANRAVDGIACCLFAVHVVSALLLMVAEMEPRSTSLGDNLTNAVLVMQLLAIIGLVIPAYIDSLWALAGAIRSLVCCCCQPGLPEDREAADRDTRPRFLQSFATMWCTMLADNLLACARYTGKRARMPHDGFEQDCPPYPSPRHELPRPGASNNECIDSASSATEDIYEPYESMRRRAGPSTQSAASDWEDRFIGSVRPRFTPGGGNPMSSVFGFESTRAGTLHRTTSRPVISSGGISFMFRPVEDNTPRPRSSLVPLGTRGSLESDLTRPSDDSFAESRSSLEALDNPMHEHPFRHRSGPMRGSAQIPEGPEEEAEEGEMPRRMFVYARPEHPSRISVVVSDNSSRPDSQGPSGWARMQSVPEGSEEGLRSSSIRDA